MTIGRATAGPVLEVRDLTIALPPGRRPRHAVRNVSFDVGRGEIVCLVGESGSGKSVIAQGVMGLLPKRAAGHRRAHPAAGRGHHAGDARRGCASCARRACR